MKTLFKKHFLTCVLACILIFAAKPGKAQTTDEFKKHMDKWWQNYVVFLKKAAAEPSDQKVIVLFKNATGTLIADHKKILHETATWKKTHSAKDMEDLDKWMERNKNEQEMEKLAEDPKVMERNEKNKELVKAVQDFRLALMRP